MNFMREVENIKGLATPDIVLSEAVMKFAKQVPQGPWGCMVRTLCVGVSLSVGLYVVCCLCCLSSLSLSLSSCVFVSVCACVSLSPSLSLCACMFIYIYTCVCEFLCFCLCLSACFCVCVFFVCLFACLSVCLFVCSCVCACKCKCLGPCLPGLVMDLFVICFVYEPCIGFQGVEYGSFEAGEMLLLHYIMANATLAFDCWRPLRVPSSTVAPRRPEFFRRASSHCRGGSAHYGACSA